MILLPHLLMSWHCYCATPILYVWAWSSPFLKPTNTQVASRSHYKNREWREVWRKRGERYNQKNYNTDGHSFKRGDPPTQFYSAVSWVLGLNNCFVTLGITIVVYYTNIITCGCQERVLDPLRLELQTVASQHVGSGTWIQEQPMLLTAELFFLLVGTL